MWTIVLQVRPCSKSHAENATTSISDIQRVLNLKDQLALVHKEVNITKIQVGGRVIAIFKYSFNLLTEWSSWMKSKIYYFRFGILVNVKSLIEFFSIGPIDPLSIMLKILWFVSPVRSYGMRKAMVVASFQHILAPGYGGN